MSMLLFPHERVRDSQKDMIQAVQQAIIHKNHAIIHAPTGLGKTAAALAPALSEALEKGLTVFFLTSRHTQHEIAIKTLEAIRDRHKTNIVSVDIIGKKWMCLHEGADRLPSMEFTEFCRHLREDGKCDYYNNLRKGEKLTAKGELAVHELLEKSPVKNKTILQIAHNYGVCPYYTSMEIAKKAQVIIADYYYIFHPSIREQFLNKSSKELSECVVIVDEAHNLPNRIKDLASARLSNLVIKRAIKEAEKYRLEEVAQRLEHVLEVIRGYSQRARNEQHNEVRIHRNEFVNDVQKKTDFDAFAQELQDHGDAIREESQMSFVGSVGSFLESWQGGDEGFARIFSNKKGLREEVQTLSYRCLDASIVAGEVIRDAHSIIMMSGTLTPATMYKELMGFQEATTEEFGSPFPKNNKLSIIIPQTSTKFVSRSSEQYQRIAEVLKKVVAKIPGNVAVFFPSYYLLEEVNKSFQTMTEKTVFVENSQMSTNEKQEFINRFRSYKNQGAVLMGVISGNFGEGIDLPGDELKGVVIVGLPLVKPDLETESLIKYYDEKFGKGWDYGYLFPAFNKALQSAGRCIRSETDRGVIVFLDERYAWPQYKRCFPGDWDVKISLLYEGLIEGFFDEKNDKI